MPIRQRAKKRGGAPRNRLIPLETTGHGFRVIRLARESPASARLVVIHLGETLLIPLSEIRLITTERNYVLVHSSGEPARARGPLRALMALLDQRFFRVRREAVVNLERVVRVSANGGHGQLLLHMDDGTSTTSGRDYSPAVRARLLGGNRLRAQRA